MINGKGFITSYVLTKKPLMSLTVTLQFTGNLGEFNRVKRDMKKMCGNGPISISLDDTLIRELRNHEQLSKTNQKKEK